MSGDIIATWMVSDSPEDASGFPQTGPDSSRAAFQNVYWRCVACFFATSRQVGNTARHVLYTNVARLPTVDGVSLDDLLHTLAVEVRTVPITHRLGRSRTSTWNNQFYILDIIRDLNQQTRFERAIVVDSDCIWVRPADDLLHDISKYGAVTLCIPYARDHLVNGGSRLDMREAAQTLAGVSLSHVPHYCGGELFAATSETVGGIAALAQELWPRLRDSPSGTVSIFEEGHFLSIIYELMKVPVGTAEPHIRRMWTALRLNNVSWEDVHSSRCIWHLPEEKKVGFVELFSAVRNPSSSFWRTRPSDVRERMAETMGLPRRGASQWLRKLKTRAVDRWEMHRAGVLDPRPGGKIARVSTSQPHNK